MASKVSICNLALFHLGSSKRIASLDEKSQEARSCSAFYDQALEQTFRDYDWPFASKIAALALVAADPTAQWRFAYRYPTDCVKFRFIQSDTRVVTNTTREPCKQVYDSTGPLIYADKPEAIGEYTVLVTNPEHYPPDFVMSLSLRIASYIAPSITGGDPFNLGVKSLQKYAIEIKVSQSNSGNEEQKDPEPESELITGRDS